MKTSTILLGASAAFVAAQTEFPAGFPQCGVTCITNMLAKSGSEFNCGASDIQCLCSKANFLYGVRDCADQACTDSAQADAVKQVGLSYCANAGVAVSGISYTGEISATVSPTTTIFAGEAPATTTTTATESEGSSGAAGASSTAVSTVFSETTDSAGSTTSVAVSTVFSDVAGAAVSTVAVSTVFSESTDSAGSTTSVAVSTIYSTASLSESTVTGTTTGTETNTVSNESTTLTATHTSTGTTLSTSTGTAHASGSSSSSSAFAAQQTVGPAGLIAAAGMGIVLML